MCIYGKPRLSHCEDSADLLRCRMVIANINELRILLIELRTARHNFMDENINALAHSCNVFVVLCIAADQYRTASVVDSIPDSRLDQLAVIHGKGSYYNTVTVVDDAVLGKLGDIEGRGLAR